MPFDLTTQAQFEELWFNKTEDPLPTQRPGDKAWLVYYTAAWCGPCKKLSLEELDAAAKEKGLVLYKCDVVKNEYTVGYCGVRAFPTFHFCIPGKIVETLQSNNTDQVADWIRSL